jgi:TPR repeat protein
MLNAQISDQKKQRKSGMATGLGLAAALAVTASLLPANVNSAQAKSTKECTGSVDAKICFTAAQAIVFGWGGNKPDAARAGKLFKESCDMGYMPGCNVVGLGYNGGLGGLGFPKDTKKAVGFFQMACDGGDMEGCGNLARRYEAGEGVAKDPQKALALYTKACNGNDMDGCYSAGYALEQGTGIPQDFKGAAKFYNRACDANKEQACAGLGDLYRNGQGVTIDLKKAERYYRKTLSIRPDAEYAKDGLKAMGLKR